MKKKATLLICAFLIITFVFSACGTKNVPKVTNNGGAKITEDPNVTAAGQFPIVKDKISLTIGMPQNSTVKDYTTNDLTKWYQEKSNIDLKFELFPEKDAAQKIQIMVSSGSDLPEVLVGFNLNDTDILKYGQQKAIVPLNGYLDKYGFYMKQMLANVGNKDFKNIITLADGNIYYVPRYVESSPNEWSLRSLINKKWLDKLGLKVPTTTEEFYQVLKAFKEKDPNGNGKADEIPFVGSNNGWRQQPYDFLFDAFIYNDATDHFSVNNGKLDVAYTKDEWRDALKYMNKLCKEGLLSPLTFTQDQAQYKQMVDVESDKTIVGTIIASTGNLFNPKNQTALDYVPLPPLKGPKGVQWTTYYPSLPSSGFVITKSCKNPLAAFRLGDLMLSEEASMRQRFGVPERDWVKAKPDEKSMFGAAASIKPLVGWGQVQNAHWAEAQATFRNYSMTDGQVWDGNPLNSQYIAVNGAKVNKGMAPKEVVIKQNYTIDEADKISEVRNTINTYVTESIARFITGDMNIDTEWENYKNEISKMGLKNYIDINQKVYDRMNKK